MCFGRFVAYRARPVLNWFRSRGRATASYLVSNRPGSVQYKSPLLQSLQSNLRLRHLSRRTEEAYVYWTRRFVRFCGLRHPSELGDAEVQRFRSSIAMSSAARWRPWGGCRAGGCRRPCRWS